MAYQYEHLETRIIDQDHKEVDFKCMNFIYTIRCFQGIIQFIKGQRPEIYLANVPPPTPEEIEAHDLRREEFNGNHQELQAWIDSL